MSEYQVEADEGLACLVLLLGFHQIGADPQQLRHAVGKAEKADTGDLVRLARRLGAKAKLSNLPMSRLQDAPLPAIAKGRGGDFFILARVKDGEALVQWPGQPPKALSLADLSAIWAGEAVLVTTRSEIPGGAKFDVTWFIPALVRYRGLLGEVLAASLTLQLFALATPLIFQVVIDKILVHRGLTTLDVLAIGLGAVIVMETLLGGLRAALFTHTTSRVDVELGVAEAALLRQTGRLEVRALALGAPLYDPSAHLRAVKSVGAVPWEGLIDALDRTFDPKAAPLRLEQPAAPSRPPSLVEGPKPLQADRPLGEHSRTTPIPGTVGYER